MLRRSVCISYPSPNSPTTKTIKLSILLPKVEAIRINFRFEFDNVWFEMSEFIKCKRSYRNLLLYYCKSYVLRRPQSLYDCFLVDCGFIYVFYKSITYS